MARSSEPRRRWPRSRRGEWGLIAASIGIGASLALGLIGLLSVLVVPTVPTCGCPEYGAIAVSSGEEQSRYVSGNQAFFPTAFSVQSVSSSLSAGQLAFTLDNSGGQVVPFDFVGVIDISGCWVGYYSGSTDGWQSGPPAMSPSGSTSCGPSPGLASQLDSGDQFFLVTSQSVSAQGYSLLVQMPGPNGGTTSAPIP